MRIKRSGNFKIHFFWAGGHMYDQAIGTIRHWSHFIQSVNSSFDLGFKINIWLDSIGTSQANIESMRDVFRRIGDIILIRDINTEDIACPIIRYQIDRLRPNYGAASDIARYRILQKEKGLYLDTDVLPPESVEDFLEAWACETLVLPNQFATQLNNQCSDVVLYNTPDGEGHPLIQFMIENTRLNYLVSSCDFSLRRKSSERYRLVASEVAVTWRQAYLAETDHHNSEYTLRVGANLLMSHWLELQYKTLGQPENITDSANKAGYHVVSEASLRQPLHITGSQKSWKASAVKEVEDISVALHIALQTIEFEIIYRGVLRLDDHVMNVIESTRFFDISEEVIVDRFIEDIRRLLTQHHNALVYKILMVQLTFRFQATELFCEELGLLPKTCLIETEEDNLNCSTHAILKYAYQPFEDMHIEALADGKKDEEANADLRSTYNQRMKLARVNFLIGFVKFYHKKCSQINIRDRLSATEQLLLRKVEVNLPRARQYLIEIKEELPSEQQKQTIEQEISGIDQLLIWKERALNYRRLVNNHLTLFARRPVMPAATPEVARLTR